MPTLEIRRHSIRKAGGGSQLSQAGVDLARSLGATIGPFRTVVATVVPRARETAVAMGFAVDHELVTLADDPDLYEEAAQIDWATTQTPFAELAAVLAVDSGYRRYAHATAAVWRDLLTPLEANDAVLVVGHSGELEAGLVACFPASDHAAWGRTFAPCEGARLRFDGTIPSFRSVELLRLPS